jgi:hypothetical protein
MINKQNLLIAAGTLAAYFIITRLIMLGSMLSTPIMLYIIYIYIQSWYQN